MPAWDSTKDIKVVDIIYNRCAGLDVHKKSVVACRVWRSDTGKRACEIERFGTTTSEILRLSDWLSSAGITNVAMESTGVFWKPVWNLLEANFELILVNPQHIKQVPGRKTDTKDSEWIATLMEHGLLRASFVPPAPQRAFREMTRTRSMFIRERADMVNRVQKILEDANIKLASVASDVMGVSGRAMINAMIEGQSDPKILADLAKHRMRSKIDQLEEALLGQMRPHHRAILKQLLSVIDSLDRSITAMDKEIEAACAPFKEAVERLSTMSGIGLSTAQMILSEIGTDMSAFPSDDHLCAWAGVAPGNNESAGKRLSGRVRKGNQSLRTALVQSAHAAARTKNTYMAALFKRIAARRGAKRAIIAVAHAMLKAIYHMLEAGTNYQELGVDYFDKVDPKRTEHRLIRRLTAMGYYITKTTEAIPDPA
jgi:transposase